MEIISKKGVEVSLTYKTLNEENFEKIQEGNVLTKEGYFYEDFKVGENIYRKIHPTWLTKGRIEQTPF